MNMILNADCMEYMKNMKDNNVTMTLTDIPYGVVNRESNGIRNLDKRDADTMTFDIFEFLRLVYKVTSGCIIIFCAKEQFSSIYEFFADKQADSLGTVRQIVWEKTNPSPMNGKLSICPE